MKKRIEVVAANDSNDAFERGVVVGVLLSLGAFVWIELALSTLFGG